MKKKTLTIAIALVLVVALAVGATYAYLTAKTEVVTNTFVVGKVIDPGDEKNPNFVLDESKAFRNTDGTYRLETDQRVKANDYTVVPGVNLPKDPTVLIKNQDNVADGSDYYLFVKVTAGDAYQAGKDGTKLLSYTVDTAKWLKLDVDGEEVYVYAADGKTASVNHGNFAATGILKADAQGNAITVANADLSGLTKENSALTFQAYVCQSAGLTPTQAYAAAAAAK